LPRAPGSRVCLIALCVASRWESAPLVNQNIMDVVGLSRGGDFILVACCWDKGGGTQAHCRGKQKGRSSFLVAAQGAAGS
jgi:hypothetical protein